MKVLVAAALVLGSCLPAFAKTHSFIYPVPCATLWPAVKDTLRNSGKYGIIGIDSTEMTASYNIGGFLTGKRINSAVLNKKDNGCELQIQTSFSGLVNDDVADFKKRVDQSLKKLAEATPETPAQTPTPPVTPGTAPAPPSSETSPAPPK